jgi:hypothetical protein
LKVEEKWLQVGVAVEKKKKAKMGGLAQIYSSEVEGAKVFVIEIDPE